MNFDRHFRGNDIFLMQCSVSGRLKNDFGREPDAGIGYAAMIYDDNEKPFLMRIYDDYAAIARAYGLPLMLLTPTEHIRMDGSIPDSSIENILHDNITQLKYFKAGANLYAYVGGRMPLKPGEFADEDEAEGYHSHAAALFAAADADFLYSGPVDTIAEAIGMARAMENSGLPYIIALKPEADGRLADGTSISDAISITDGSVLHQPLCFMADGVDAKMMYAALSRPYNMTLGVKRRFQGIKADVSGEDAPGTDAQRVIKPFRMEMDIHRLSDYINLKIIGGGVGTDAAHLKEIASRL